MKLSKKEKDLLITEITQRCKDVVYMNAEKQAKIIVDNLNKSDFEKTRESLIINFKIEMCIGDILQIVGRSRRRTHDLG